MKLMTQFEILSVLSELISFNELNSVRIGLFGSYSRNEQKEDSDIDIVYSVDKSLNSFNEIQFFIEKCLEKYTNDFDIIWLELLEEDDKKMDSYFEKEGLGVNENSPYKELLKDVIWVN